MNVIQKLIFEDCRYVQETPPGSQIRERRIARLQKCKYWLENYMNFNKPTKWIQSRKWLNNQNKGMRVNVNFAFSPEFVDANFQAFEYAVMLNDNFTPETKKVIDEIISKKKLEIFGELGDEG